MDNVIVGVFLLASGAFLVLAGAFNWGLMMRSRRGRTAVNLFGAQGARIFYAVIGLICIVTALVLML